MGVGPPRKQHYLGARLLKEKPEENHWCLSTPGCPQERETEDVTVSSSLAWEGFPANLLYIHLR